MIEELEREIMMKNTRVRQLQDVVGVFKEEIEEIVGGDLKVVDGIMVELLEVKGKWVEMQRRVEGVKGLREEVELKERVKGDIIKKINDKVDKLNK
jgi:plasmid maintenance system antidote protein VapI